jgi:surface antigen
MQGKQTVDKWGMYVCECVSYTSSRVQREKDLGRAVHNMPRWGGNWSNGYRGGNAKEWIHNAKIAGIPWGKTPKVNSVGVKTSGTYGHVVWVEAVSGNRIYISQYNYVINGVKGEYSEMWIDASAFDGYIYFNEWK